MKTQAIPRLKSAMILKKRMPHLRELVARQPRVLAVFLFGSLADGYATPQSDIDLGVLFDRAIGLKAELAFAAEVSAALGTDKVDVVNLNRASLLFRFRAVAGKLLYERDAVRVSYFIEQTVNAHRAFEPRAQAMLRDYFDSLGEAYAVRPRTR